MFNGNLKERITTAKIIQYTYLQLFNNFSYSQLIAFLVVPSSSVAIPLIVIYIGTCSDLYRITTHAHIKLFNKESTTPLKKVTKISTVCKVFKQKANKQEMLFGNK